MAKGRVARAYRREELQAGESLEEIYFAITEGEADAAEGAKTRGEPR
jgi:hypothetical protein